MGVSARYCQVIPEVDLADFSVDAGEICTAVRSVPFGYESKSCGPVNTPPVQWASYNFFSRNLGEALSVDIDCWVGVDEQGCVWMGSEAYQVCVNTCKIGKDITPASARSLVEDFLQALEEGAKDFGSDSPKQVPDLYWGVGKAVLITVIVLIVLYIFGPSVGLGAFLI